jgi:Flp pilus assembly protein TadG
MIPPYFRRSRGFVSSLFFIAAVPIIAALGVLAVDVTHFNAARCWVQSVTDAAALSGAHDLYAYNSKFSDSGSKGSKADQEAINTALTVAQRNFMVSEPKGETITASVLSPSGTAPSASNSPTICRVVATKQVPSLYCYLIGGVSPSVTASSQAGSRSPIDTVEAGGIYPLVIGFRDLQPVNSPHGGKVALDALHAGETFHFELPSNAAWSAIGAADESTLRKAQLAYGEPSLPLQTFHVGATGGAAAVAVGDKAICSTANSNPLLRGTDGFGPGLSQLPKGTLVLCPLVDHVGSSGVLSVNGFALLKLTGNFTNHKGQLIFSSEIIHTVIPVGHTTGKDLGSYSSWAVQNSPFPNHLIQ